MFDLISACKASRKKSVFASLPKVALNRSGEPPVVRNYRNEYLVVGVECFHETKLLKIRLGFFGYFLRLRPTKRACGWWGI